MRIRPKKRLVVRIYHSSDADVSHEFKFSCFLFPLRSFYCTFVTTCVYKPLMGFLVDVPENGQLVNPFVEYIL